MSRTYFIAIIFLLSSCSSHYKIKEHKVEHVSWNTGHGTVIKEISDANPNTFEQLTEWYGKDSENAYWKHLQIYAADARSFKAISNYYAVDINHGYFTTQILEGSDGQTFEYLGGNWAKDQNTYFYNKHRVAVCDYLSFKIIDEQYSSRAIDEYCYYWNSEVVPIKDRASLEILSGDYAKDKYAVYWGKFILEGANPSKFELLNDRLMSLGKDGQRCFMGRRILTCSDLNNEGKAFCSCPQ